MSYYQIRSMPQTKAMAHDFSGDDIAVISLITPGDNLPQFRDTPKRWLVVECEDTGHMEPHQARRIADFCHQNEGRNLVLAVHCLMGVSRSPSVANAIAAHYGTSPYHMARHTEPKARLTEVVRDALQHKMPEPSHRSVR